MKYALAIIVLLLNFSIAKAQEDSFIGSDLSGGADNSEISTLNSALTEAFRNNPEFRVAHANLEATSELHSQALSNCMPSISANIGESLAMAKIITQA